uniref:SCP domain-containing protein n=1 Tax=Leersia perrieri TaxID=77586 RepID=A0A0D9WV56_9ORYZ
MERVAKKGAIFGVMVAMAMAILATTAMAADFSDAEKKLLVKLHNEARAAVGVKVNVSWSNMLLAAKAREHVKTCSDDHIDGNPYGENLWLGSWPAAGWVGTPADAMNSWVAGEKPLYDYASNQCIGGEYNCVHYTQVVWRNTTQIGCARVSDCKIEGVTKTLIACYYNPPGNVQGQKPY